MFTFIWLSDVLLKAGLLHKRWKLEVPVVVTLHYTDFGDG